MKKITSYIIFLAVVGMFLMTAVSALDLETQDFGDHFKMDVPKNSTFKEIKDSYDDGAVYKDKKNGITISYTDKDNYAGTLPSFTADAGTKMYEDGDFGVMEFPDGTNMVTFIDESHMIQMKSKMAVKDMESMLNTTDF